MTYDQDWCDQLRSAVGDATADAVTLRLLYVVTDTDEGKVAFNMDIENGAPTAVTTGKLPRGEKADVTVTIKDVVLRQLWSGEVTRDAAFMAGDIKIEGAYQRWLDELVPLFSSDPWATAWSASA